jgi:hypothetical protein
MKMTQVSNRSNKVYEFNYDVWLGKMSIKVNDQSSQKVKKLIFNYKDEGETRTITVKGNLMSGFKLIDGDEEIEMLRKLTGLEWVLVVYPIALGFLGGAIGGGLGVLVGAANAFMVRQTKNPIIKIFISLIFAGLAFVAYSLVASALLDVMNA